MARLIIPICRWHCPMCGHNNPGSVMNGCSNCGFGR